MASNHSLRQLHSAITELNLDAQHPELADIRFQIENHLIDEQLAQDLLLAYDPEIRHAMDHPNPLRRPPTSEELYACGPPDIEIGHLADSPEVRFGLRIRDRPRNILIAGNAGSGKTNATVVILEGVNRLNKADPERFISLIILDKKNDYAPRIRDWSNVLRLNAHHPGTRIGLSSPEGVAPKIWANWDASIFCPLADLVSAWTGVSAATQWLHQVMNAADPKRDRWPSFALLLELARSGAIEKWLGKKEYARSLINQLEAITQATDVFDCFGGLDLERDIIRPRKHMLFELNNLSPSWVRQFLMNLLFAQVLIGRMLRGQKTSRTEVIFVLDESDQDVTAEVDRAFPDNMSPLSLMLRMGREYGIMAIIGLGRLQHASAYALSEAQYQLTFNQSDARSIVMARSMLALPPIADAMFPALQPGYCIARESQGAWEHPMLLKIDHLPLTGVEPQ